jgi:molybdopterin-containing oxidoreductase family iron-sulfur binding subunit
MKKEKKDNASRRKFLSLSLLGGASLAAGTAIGQTPEPKTGSGEKVKMLTQDGKLVEVDKSILESAKRQKVTTQDIFQWVKPVK